MKCLLFISKGNNKEKECIVTILSISLYCIIYGNFFCKLLFSAVVSRKFLFVSSKLPDLDINFEKYLFEIIWYSRSKTQIR